MDIEVGVGRMASGKCPHFRDWSAWKTGRKDRMGVWCEWDWGAYDHPILRVKLSVELFP